MTKPLFETFIEFDEFHQQFILDLAEGYNREIEKKESVISYDTGTLIQIECSQYADTSSYIEINVKTETAKFDYLVKVSNDPLAYEDFIEDEYAITTIMQQYQSIPDEMVC